MPIGTLAASSDNHKRLTTHGPSPRNRCSQNVRLSSDGVTLPNDTRIVCVLPRPEIIAAIEQED